MGFDGHFVLFEIAAKAADFDDAGDAGKLPLHDPVLDGAQFHGIVLLFVARLNAQHVLVYFPQAGGDGHQLGLAQAHWDFILCPAKLFLYILPGVQDLHPIFEDHGHYREPEARDRTDFNDVGDVGQGQFYRIGDKLFYFLCRQKGGDGDDLDLVVGDVWHRVNRDTRQGIQA